MSYPDVIKAGELRQGDRVHTENPKVTRRILATFRGRHYSFIRLSVEGEETVRNVAIGQALAVIREGTW